MAGGRRGCAGSTRARVSSSRRRPRWRAWPPGLDRVKNRPSSQRGPPTCIPAGRRPFSQWRRGNVAKVIASSVRKGNVLDLDGKLAVVIHAENIHPGKGTPVTHLEMRRISDGVKVTERYRTTDQVERAYLEEKDFSYLYEDDMGIHFMQPETYDQITIPKDIVGDQAQWLQEGMVCSVSLHEGVPIAIELPQRVS